ncbi:hypothetical protein DL95DRAFT_388407, partial [Leptodontidium sp. 2 PMI_412]
MIRHQFTKTKYNLREELLKRNRNTQPSNKFMRSNTSHQASNLSQPPPSLHQLQNKLPTLPHVPIKR